MKKGFAGFCTPAEVISWLFILSELKRGRLNGFIVVLGLTVVVLDVEEVRCAKLLKFPADVVKEGELNVGLEKGVY